MGEGRKPRVFLTVLAAAIAAATLAGSASGAVTKEVKLTGIEFKPPNTSAKVGDSVHWSRGSGTALEHNVHQNQDIFRSGDTTTGPIDFTRKFSAGTFPYRCDEHGLDGMRGRVKIPVTVVPDQAQDHPLVRWAATGTNTGGRYDVQFKVGNGAWQNWKQNSSAKRDVFGSGDEPIDLKKGTTYRFRARSQKGDGQSGWSPPKVYVHD